MYVCGPTVWDYLHVGNFRGPVVFEMIRNWLEELGYQVTYVYNYTDVDDKILNRAKEEGRKPQEVAEQFIAEFQKDFKALGLRPHSHNPRVTQTIPQIIELIEKLTAAGKAYVVDGEVFYDVESFEHYGCLSGRRTEESKSGVRIEVDPKKRNPQDFSLWKPTSGEDESWPSPWGPGRPGWHIECTAMIHTYLGEQIDIHGGGLDLLFPHHENEIAQSEGATQKQYARYWIHNNMFTFSGAKMSKSLGNVKTMRSFLDKYDGEVFKFLVLSVHYRSECEYSDETIHNSIKGLAKFYSTLARAHAHLQNAPEDIEPVVPVKFQAAVDETRKKVAEALNDDFNTPVAFAALYDLTRLANQNLRWGMKATKDSLGIAKAYQDTLREMGKIFSLFQRPPEEFLSTMDRQLMAISGIDADEVQNLVDQRLKAKAAKDYPLADSLRDKLTSMGIALQDLGDTTRWEVQK
jgi:cysteinyl-tRNA synthetase